MKTGKFSNKFKPDLKTWLFLRAYSHEAPLRTWFKRHFTLIVLDLIV